MDKHQKILNHLGKLAEDVAPVCHARLCAAIVYKNEIVAYGINSLKTHPFQQKYGKNHHSIFLHAEVDAIKNALRRLKSEDLSKASLYVARRKIIGNSWTFGMSKPCSGCQKAIAAFDIKNVLYTNDGDYKYTRI